MNKTNRLKNKFSLLIGLSILVVGLLFLAPNDAALAAGRFGVILGSEEYCISLGGTWKDMPIDYEDIPSVPLIIIENPNLLFSNFLFGLASETGTCTYPGGNSIATERCGTNYSYIITYKYYYYEESCVEPFSQVKGGDQFSGNLEESMTITFSNNYNGSVIFPEGDNCLGNCIAGPFLPESSKNALPSSGVYGTAYILIFNLDGTLNLNGTFEVCFDTNEIDNPVMYQFVSGTWQEITSGTKSPLCFDGSGGTGAFYLGSN